MGYASVHQLLLGYVPEDYLDNVFGLCYAFRPYTKEGAEMILKWKDCPEQLRTQDPACEQKDQLITECSDRA